ncbi:MAG: cell division protein FtsQ/DivIB [Coriobacteriales bacterium]
MASSSSRRSGSSGSRTSVRASSQRKSTAGSAQGAPAAAPSGQPKRKSVRKEQERRSSARRQPMPPLGDSSSGSSRPRRAAGSASSRRSSAPAGTQDMAVSQSAQRRRNRDIDDAAAGRGRRVGDIRAAERAERAARARRRYLSYVLKIAAVIAAVLLLVFGSIFVYRSNLLAVQTVTVTGVEHLTDQEVTQLAAVPDDSTLLRLDAAGICSRLEEHPWVQQATISRQFPHTIKIHVTERTPSAAVKISSKSIWVVSTDGAWLSAATEEDWKSYRRIVDVDTNMAAPVAGSDVTDEGILNALAVFDQVSPELAEMIKSISAESAVKTSLTLKGGVEVAFGMAEDMELKEADIWALLDKYEGKISYINVRVPDRPTYRTSA